MTWSWRNCLFVLTDGCIFPWLPGYTPALACAPNKDVADCLALILSTMMPVSSSSTLPSFTFNTINHYTNTSKTVTFDSLPVMRSDHSSYCTFNNIGREDGYPYTEEDELNDSDSETYWTLYFVGLKSEP